MKKVDITEFSALINKFGLDYSEIAKKILIQKLNIHWMDMVGPILSKNSEIDTISDNILQIKVNHNAVKQELLFIQYKIIKESNKIMNENLIQKLKIIVSTSTPLNKFNKN